MKDKFEKDEQLFSDVSKVLTVSNNIIKKDSKKKNLLNINLILILIKLLVLIIFLFFIIIIKKIKELKEIFKKIEIRINKIIYNIQIKKSEKIKYNYTLNNWKNEKLIIHALGKYNNTTYTNSLESLKYWHFNMSINLMEADFHLTKDNHIVLSHDFKYLNKIPTLEEFKNSKTKGNCSPLTFEDLVIFMEQNKDLYILTDTKYSSINKIKIEFDEMTEILLRHKNVAERFIIAVYNERMFEFINKRKKYPFNNFMFTLYQRWNIKKGYKDLENIFSFAKKYKALFVEIIPLDKSP